MAKELQEEQKQLLDKLKETKQKKDENETRLPELRFKLREHLKYITQQEWYEKLAKEAISKDVSIKEFLADRFNIVKEINYEDALELLLAITELQQQKPILTNTYRQLLRDVWETDIALKQIASTIDETENATYVYMTKQEWFNVRKTK